VPNVKENSITIRKYGHSQRSPIKIEGETRTKQSAQAETDINNIMARYLKTGHISWVNRQTPTYGISDGQTFHEAMNIVCEAQENFSELPAHIRKRFGNDPAQFLDFVTDENNKDEAIRLGMLNTPAAAEEDFLPSSAAENTVPE
jgi:phage internal scaffolding protein